jgi:DNA (cytosine-5)-methyltransferase 1
VSWYDLGTSSWRTWQLSFIEEWETFSGAFPPLGMMRSGVAFGRETLDFPTYERERLSLPTPTVCGNYNRVGASQTSGDGYATAFKKMYGRFPTAEETEVVMGFPRGWTHLETLCRPKSPN